jgi:hypothetical protein
LLPFTGGTDAQRAILGLCHFALLLPFAGGTDAVAQSFAPSRDFAPACDFAPSRDFAPAEKVTGGGAKHQFSRLSNGVAAFDTSGTLNVTYWSGSETQSTSPDSPTYVLYRSWSPSAGWSAQTQVDDSFNTDGHIGGRHPSLAVAPNGTVWTVWHDYRNCTPGNWMDNTEIYADFKPKGGQFTSTDLRLTTTPVSPDFAGDNGFCPRVVVDSAGRVRVAWYDFHFSRSSDTQMNISDIFLKTSDTSGAFDPGQTMESMRLTRFEDRGGLKADTPSYTMPDLDVDTSGTCHLIWVAGTGYASNLYYAALPAGATTANERQLAANVRSYFDPPHIDVAPNGDVWIAYADAGDVEKVMIRRKRAGQADFDAPVTIASDPTVANSQPDLEVDGDGNAHVVWVRRRGTADRDVVYAVYDPVEGKISAEAVLSPAPAKWDRPSLALRADGAAVALFEENTSLFEGDIWFASSLPKPRVTAADSGAWNLFQ